MTLSDPVYPSRKLGVQAALRADVWDRSDKHCHYCGKELHPLRDFVVDHVVPRCAGGTDEADNVVAACWPCNHRKGLGPDKEYCMRMKRERGELRKRRPVRTSAAQRAKTAAWLARMDAKRGMLRADDV